MRFNDLLSDSWFQLCAVTAVISASFSLYNIFVNSNGNLSNNRQLGKPTISSTVPNNQIDRIRGLADSGDVHAQYQLGALYNEGTNVGQNYTEAVKWLRKAADQNHREAQFLLGFNYINGQGVPKDPVEADKWWRKAADQEHPEAQFLIGVSYSEGDGVPKDSVEAAKWWRKAADHEFASAQYNLGNCYRAGEGVPKDPVEAVKWWRKAAVQNDSKAQTNLGYSYANGYGVQLDYSEAVLWWKKAADNGDVKGQYCLGLSYFTGKGVSKNLSEAVRLWQKAAAQGDKDSQEQLRLVMGESVSGQDPTGRAPFIVMPHPNAAYTDYGEGNVEAARLRRHSPKMFNFDRAALRDVLRYLADDAGLPYICPEDSDKLNQKLVTFTMETSSFSALEAVCKANGICLTYDTGVWKWKTLEK